MLNEYVISTLSAVDAIEILRNHLNANTDKLFGTEAYANIVSVIDALENADRVVIKDEEADCASDDDVTEAQEWLDFDPDC